MTLSHSFSPNLITLIGWLIVVNVHIIFLFLANPENFGNAYPAYLGVLQAVSMFIYVIMDNSDGKQARKIGASSPLGMMFDHGLDMINCFCCTSTLCRLVQIGNNWSFVIVLIMTMA
jgi:ethanolaminephosphotransferase